MAVAFDSANGNGGYPPGGLSFSHSLGDGSGNDRIVLVGVLIKGSDPVVTACTYNGTSMSFIGSVEESYYSAYMRLRIYALLDSALPASSGSYTVSVTATDAYDGYIAAASYTGVSQTTPPYTVDSDFSNPPFDNVEYSTNRTVVASEGMVVDFGGIGPGLSTSQTSASGQTERRDAGYNGTYMVVSDKAFSSSGSLSMAHTPDDTYDSFLHALVELAASSPGPTQISLLGNDGWNTDSGSSISQSYTCHAGTNRKLLVCMGSEITDGATHSSVTYNSVSLTKIDQYSHSVNDISWWYLDDASFPGTPGSYTLVATFSKTVGPGFMAVMEVAGAKQGSVDAENSSLVSSSDTLNTTITTLVDGSWICGAVICGDQRTFSPQSGQTELEDILGGGGGAAMAMGYEAIPTAGSTNMEWQTSSSVNRILQMLISVAPVPSEVANAVALGSNF